MEYVKSILKKNRTSLIKIYAMLIGFQILMSLEPAVLGASIDGILKRNYYPLLLLIGLELTATAVSYRRMVYDTAIFNRIHDDIVQNFLKTQTTTNTSMIAGRVENAGWLVHLFEGLIPHWFSLAVAAISSWIYILYSDSIAAVMLLILIPTLLALRKLNEKTDKSIRMFNSLREKRVQSIESGTMESFLKRRSFILLVRSTLQGRNWTILNLIRFFLLISCLIVICFRKDSLTEGQIVSTWTYLNQFLSALLSLPFAIEAWYEIRDSIRRLQ